MSIQVSHLTKVFGRQPAVKDISFTVREGEIVGFLGPNGAGKSTTMKVITGYLPPTAGTASVNGKDVTQDPMFVKQCTGYLGEHNPLYLDMYVHEYLDFVAALYRIDRGQRRKRVEEMIDLCGLGLEQHKKINMLSKGYRQRIGLAQALIHDPPVLVLDEPTSGLDPNQLVEIRRLIKAVSANKTVLFSSHILQEVQALCERVIVINRGELVADDRLENLTRTGSDHVVIEFAEIVSEELLAQAEGVRSVSRLADGKYRLVTNGDRDIRPALIRFAADHQLPLVGLSLEENSLESVFSQLTRPETNQG
ncbi:MAG: gliding motility-associated ABC transporter ATP-binding subunit GldA [Cyclobacteriaceae bacterium]|nr:gliding motility-associated ABC transporter ATP-binding subunit GldA [Cyclobacteriaceae bacterium]